MPSPKRMIKVSGPIVPVASQLELFLVDFQTKTGLENTNTIELFDALPLYQLQAYSAATDAPRTEEIEFRKRRITATVKPAGIVINGKMVYTFAGTREQLVEAVLRKMASEPGDHVEFVETSRGVNFLSISRASSLLSSSMNSLVLLAAALATVG